MRVEDANIGGAGEGFLTPAEGLTRKTKQIFHQGG